MYDYLYRLSLLIALFSFLIATTMFLACWVHYINSGVWWLLKRKEKDIKYFYVCCYSFLLVGVLIKLEVYMSSLIILVLFGMAVALFSSWVKSKKETKAAELEEARQTKLAKAIAETVVKAIKDDLNCPCVITEKAGEKHDADTV